MHARRGHQILSKRIVTSRLHLNLLPVPNFLIPDYLTHKNGDRAIEVFLHIAASKLVGSFGLVFEQFRKVI